MTPIAAHPGDHAARVLALIAVANGSLKDSEMQTLERLNAFDRLGVSRRRFLQLAARDREDIGARLDTQGRLHLCDLLYFDHLLDDVHDRDTRLTVCRLAAALITADGRVSAGERAAYDRMLARWRLRDSDVTQVIRTDPLH